MNNIQPVYIVLFGLVGLILSGALAYVAFGMWREEQAKKSGAAPAAPEMPMPPAKSPPGAHEVLRVLRDDLSGRVVVEVSSRRYASLAEIQDPAVRQGLLTTLRDLERFAGAQPPPAPAAEPRAAAPAVPPQTAAPAPAPAPQPAPQPPAQAAPAGGQELRLPSMNPFKQRQVLRELEKNPPPPPKSITEQIDDLLQSKIAGTALVRRGLRVSAGPGGGALFQLDGKAFQSVDEIPDPNVAALIRAVVKEWEARQ